MRLWQLFGLFVAGSIVLSAIAEWRSDHLLLINTTDSLPNWAFLIQRHKLPARGDYLFFDPPQSALLRRHFGAKPRMFGKIVYGMPGDTISHAGSEVAVNGRTVVLAPTYMPGSNQPDIAPADVVVFVSANRPNRGLYDALLGKGPAVNVVGDANAPRFLEAAVHEAHRIAAAIA